MIKWLTTLALALAPGLALAQQGYINPPIYATGVINVVPTSPVTNTTVAASFNHPTNLNLYPIGAITTWNITLPNPPWDGQIIQLTCRYAITTLNLLTTDGSTIGSYPTTCTTPNTSFQLQFSSVYNSWLSSAGGNGMGGGSSGSSYNTSVTLSAGTANVTFSDTGSSQPNCVTADRTTPANTSYAVEGTPSGGSVTVTVNGIGTDVIKLVCGL